MNMPLLNTRDFPILNEMMSRTSFARSWFDTCNRNIDAECGHPDIISIESYKRLFTRGDIARRVVNLYPEESWSTDPMVFETEDAGETEFEGAWNKLEEETGLYSNMLLADTLSGIGRFGIILFGIDDGMTLDMPVASIGEDGQPKGTPPTGRKLIYLRAFDESMLRIKEVQINPTNPRYGLPTIYEVSSEDFNGTRKSINVHWSRTLHLADNKFDSVLYGCPRMEVVFNRLLDIRKITGGSAEMFWKGGFPGLSLETVPETVGQAPIQIDIDALKKEVQSYMEGLQRYLALQNMTAKSLSTQIADPDTHNEAQLQLIAMTLACPLRVFMGSEVGQLASGQDIIAWNKRMNKRRMKYLGPHIVRPFARRLIDYGVLPPTEKIQVDWEDINNPSDLDKAKVAEATSNAMAKYVMGGVDALVDPFHYLTLFHGMPDDEAQSIIDATGGEDGLTRTIPPPGTPAPAAPGSTQGNGNGKPKPRSSSASVPSRK